MAPIAARPSAPGGPAAAQSFTAAFILAYFHTIDEMHAVYNRYKGRTALSVDASGWRLEE